MPNEDQERNEEKRPGWLDESAWLECEGDDIEPVTLTVVYDPEVGAIAELTDADGNRFYGTDQALPPVAAALEINSNTARGVEHNTERGSE